MLHFTHGPLVRRNTLLGRVLSFGGLGVLVIALLLSLARPEMISLVLPVSLVGMLASQFGSVLLTRWSRRDRADLMLDEALKGLDGRYTLCHYLLGIHHVLLGPAGVLALVPRSELGLVQREDGRWWITGYRRGKLQNKRRELFGIDDEAQAAAKRLRRHLEKLAGEHPEWTVTPVVVFLAEGTRLESEESDPAAIHLKKLKEFVRRMPRRPGPNESEVAKLRETFPGSRRPRGRA